MTLTRHPCRPISYSAGLPGSLRVCWCVLALLCSLLHFLHVLSSLNFLQCCSLILLAPSLQLLLSGIKPGTLCCLLSDYTSSRSPWPELDPSLQFLVEVDQPGMMWIASLTRMGRWGPASQPRHLPWVLLPRTEPHFVGWLHALLGASDEREVQLPEMVAFVLPVSLTEERCSFHCSSRGPHVS